MLSKILLVDDERATLNSLKRALWFDKHDIFVASSGLEALEVLSSTDVAVIVCDHFMPAMTGAEFLERSINLRPDAVRITLTGSASLEMARASINNGRISHFLLKPWDDDQLRSVVREGVRQFEMLREIRRLHDLTRQQRDELEVKVRERTAALDAAYEETLNALVLALDSREQAAAGHSRRVAAYCLYLAQAVDMPCGAMENVYRGALLHDIGKIGIPDAVLLKPGKLTDKERKTIEQHVAIGCRFLEKTRYLDPASTIPRYHHEKYDGTGYPNGLAGEAIPIDARLFALVDVYDALRSERPYKNAMSHEQAYEIIAGESEHHFDPVVASAFLEVSSTTWEAVAEFSQHVERFEDILAACESLGPNCRSSAPMTTRRSAPALST